MRPLSASPLLPFLLLTACTSARDAAVQATTDFLDAKDRAWCDLSIRCGQIGASERGRCFELRRFYRSRAPSLMDETAAGRIALDAVAAGKCLDLLAQVPCLLPPSEAELGCDFPFTPKVEGGGACVDGRECTSAICQGSPRSGCPGTCTDVIPTNCIQDPPDGAVGSLGLFQACTADEQCAPGLACRDSSSAPGGGERICTEAAGVGQPCSAVMPCRTGLQCTGPGTGAVCQCPKPAIPVPAATVDFRGRGSSCTPFDPSISECAAGLHCNSTKQVCADALQAGGSCELDSDCASGLLCVTGADAGGSLCVPALDGDAPCNPTILGFGHGRADPCPDDMTCDLRVLECVAAVTLGDNCVLSCMDCPDPCGWPLHCTSATDDGGGGFFSGTCQRLLVLGETCMPQPIGAGDPCAEGHCDPTTAKCTLDCSQ